MPARALDREHLLVLGGIADPAGLAWFDPWRRAGDLAIHAAMPRLVPWSPADLASAVSMRTLEHRVKAIRYCGDG